MNPIDRVLQTRLLPEHLVGVTNGTRTRTCWATTSRAVTATPWPRLLRRDGARRRVRVGGFEPPCARSRTAWSPLTHTRMLSRTRTRDGGPGGNRTLTFWASTRRSTFELPDRTHDRERAAGLEPAPQGLEDPDPTVGPCSRSHCWAEPLTGVEPVLSFVPRRRRPSTTRAAAAATGGIEPPPTPLNRRSLCQ